MGNTYLTPLQKATDDIVTCEKALSDTDTKVENSLRKACLELSTLRTVLDESAALSIMDRFGIITEVNDRLCRLCRSSREDLIGQNLEIIHAAEHAPGFVKELLAHLESGQVWRGEIKHRAMDGSCFWMDTTIVPVADPAGGSLPQYVAVRHDIGRQKALQQEIKELIEIFPKEGLDSTSVLERLNLIQRGEISEQRIKIDESKVREAELKTSLKHEKLTKHLIQLMSRSFEPEIILEIIVRELGIFFELDRCLVILYEKENADNQGEPFFSQYCNSAHIQPIQAAEIPWREWKEQHQNQGMEIYHSSAPTSVSAGMQTYLKNAQVQSELSFEIKYRHFVFGRLILHQCNSPRNWTEREIDFMEILVAHIGSTLYQARLYQEQKQARQEAEEANRQKSKVLSFVAHDFKNPLASLKRFIEILENDQSDILSEKHRELIGYIAEGVYQLRNMVTDILDKARLEEGKIIPAPQWIDIVSFINELKPLFSSMSTPMNVAVHIDIQPSLSLIKADPTHLRQILINLLSNAVKYNRRGGKVFLRIYKSDDSRACVIEIQDTGPGIAPEKIPQLFTEYFRGDLSQSNLIEGTGLGLAFIKKLIELHGGTIDVESEVGVGSTFRVALPLSFSK